MLFPCCCGFIQPLNADNSFIFHSLFLSVLLLFLQWQDQQHPSSAQLAPSAAFQGGECFLSASLAPLASTAMYLALVPQLESAGKVSREQTALHCRLTKPLGPCSKEHVFVCMGRDQHRGPSESHCLSGKAIPLLGDLLGSQRGAVTWTGIQKTGVKFFAISMLFGASLVREMIVIDSSLPVDEGVEFCCLLWWFSSQLEKNNFWLCEKKPLEVKTVQM